MGISMAAAMLPPGAAIAQEPATQSAIQSDLQSLSATLKDDAAPQSQRDEAALRLISRHDPQSPQILLDVLKFDDRGGQLAVARAAADHPVPDPDFINALFALFGADRSLNEAAAQALAALRDDPEVINRLAATALSAQQREGVRLASIRAIGSVAEKQTAWILVENLLGNQQESDVIRRAAADAMARMAGLPTYERDFQQWQAWWEINNRKSDADFKADLLPATSARLDQLQRRHGQLIDELGMLLVEQYQAAPDVRKAEILGRYLSSAQPQVKTVGARIIYQNATDAKPLAPEVKEQLRTLIGDSSGDVRLAVAEALQAINDPGAVEALVAQLSQEPIPQIRAALARALVPVRDIRAIPEFLKLLSDSSIEVAEAAADGLKQLGPVLRDKDPRLAGQVGRELLNMLEQRTGDPQTADLRVAAIDAMAALRQESLLGTFSRLLNLREPMLVRRAALRALGELRDNRAADPIARWLDEEPEAGVREAAVIALGDTATFGFAEVLYRRMEPRVESEPSVRNRAWLIFQSLLPTATPEQLADWAHRFRADPEKQLQIYLELVNQLVKIKQEQELALTRENIGAIYMQLGRPAEAATYFGSALDYWKGQKKEGIITVRLIESLMESRLKARQYSEAREFAEQTVREDPSHQQTMGTKIRAEAETLKNAGELDNALLLIEEAKKMDPPLPDLYREQLQKIEKEIRQIQTEKNAARSTAPAS